MSCRLFRFPTPLNVTCQGPDAETVQSTSLLYRTATKKCLRFWCNASALVHADVRGNDEDLTVLRGVCLDASTLLSSCIQGTLLRQWLHKQCS